MDTSLEIGSIVQRRYVIEDVLGKGKFGPTYLVRDRREGQRLFVLKEVSSPNIITTTVRYGSPGYSAPEQYSRTGCITPPTDVYGVGATLYTLLTGTVPPGALYCLAQLSERQPDHLIPANEITPTLSPMVAGIVRRAMSIISDDRFPSVEHLLDALWQVSTLPPEAQRLPPFRVPAANEGEMELDAPARIRRRAWPRSETWAGEA